MTRLRRRTAFLLKAIVAFAAVCLAAEAAFRVLVPMDALVYEDGADPLLPFQLRPDSSGLKNGVYVSISAQGLRDELVPSPPPPGERRVVVVGGYETFGIGVTSEDTFVRELAEGLVDEGRARTINLSMYSYRLRQKVELACRRLQGLEPELAVLQVTEGDGAEPNPPLLRMPRLKNWIREHSRLIRWASERYYLRARPGVLVEDYEETRRAIRRFKSCAEEAGARPVLLLLPDLARPRVPSELRRGVESVSREDGVPLLDGAPVLDALPPGKQRVFLDGHFLSPTAHRALAGALRRMLKPLLRRRPAPRSRPAA